MRQLRPEKDFKLFAVCPCYPHHLANTLTLEEKGQGVYDCRRGTDLIRVIVADRLPKEQRNALMCLFSASAERLDFGRRHYRQSDPRISSVIHELLRAYRGEGSGMPYTIDDFEKYLVRKYLKGLTPEERLKDLSPEQIVEGLSPKQVQQLLDKLQAAAPTPQGKPKRKK